MQNFREETESAEEVVLRIGDTWSYMGDAVATEGADIAEAMSKASASVQSVGIEFERASAYAAIMLARTQQSGQVIGTQLNSIASRYAKITSTGYRKVTEDDEGESLSFNDVSKALQQANIQIYNSAEKTFLPMGKMLDDLSKKWDSLDSAQKKYIATAVGGTRGMNYFLTLMDNYDHAIALETEALENRGVVNQKYEVWLQGLEAAQNDLTNSTERFYSVLSADMLTDAYHAIADIVDVLSTGTEQLDGWNLKIPIVAAGLLGVAGAISKIVTIVNTVKDLKGTEFIKGFMSSGGLGMTIGVLTTAATLIGAVISSFETAQEKFDRLEGEYQEVKIKTDSLEPIVKELDELSKKTALTAEETERFHALRAELAESSISVRAIYGEDAEGLSDVAEAAKVASEELQNYRKEADAIAHSGLGAAIDVYNDRIKDVYTSKADEFIPRNELGFEINHYIGSHVTGVGEDHSLEALQQYLDELSAIIASEEYANLEKDVQRRVEEQWSRINNIIVLRNTEIKSLSEDLKIVLRDTLANGLYFDLFNENPILKENIINMFLGEDWGATDGEKISEWMDSFIKLFPEYLAKGGDLDYLFKEAVDFNGDKYSLASIILENLMTEGVDEAEIQKAMISVADILDGIAMDALQYFEMDIFTPQGAILNTVVQEMQKAMETAISNRNYTSDDELRGLFRDAVENGEKSLEDIKAFNAVINRIWAENSAGKIDYDETILQIEEAMRNFISLDDSFVEWTVTAHPDIVVSEEEIETEVNKALNDVEEYIAERTKKLELEKAESSLFKG